MERRVTVKRCEGEYARVVGERETPCGGCAGRSACGTLGSWRGREELEMCVRNDAGAREGDEVIIEVPDGSILRLALQLYGLPMAAFVAAGALAWLLARWFAAPQAELWAALGGVAGILGAYARVYRRSAGARVEAHVVRVLAPASGGDGGTRFH